MSLLNLAFVLALQVASNLVEPSKISVSWNDIAGLESVIEELRETVILPIKERELFATSNLTKAPRGVLLHVSKLYPNCKLRTSSFLSLSSTLTIEKVGNMNDGPDSSWRLENDLVVIDILANKPLPHQKSTKLIRI